MGLKKDSNSNSAIKLAAVSERSRDKNEKSDRQVKGKSPDRDKDRAGRPDKAEKDKKEKDPREKSVSNRILTKRRRKKVTRGI
jgi:hypothetical protein